MTVSSGPLFFGNSTAAKVTPSKVGSRDELSRANEAIYKQNLELSIRNKTLSVLRKLSAISTNSLSVSEATQKVVEAIVSELKFTAVVVGLVDSKKNVLRISATNQPNVLKALRNTTQEISIPFTYTGNLLIRCISDRERKITGNIFDILTPSVTQDVADAIENSIGVKTVVTYPLLLGKKALGVLSFGLSKRVDDLSRGERDTIDELIDTVAITINRAQLIEDIQLTNEKLHSVNARLEELDKLKDEFVSLASHELRTPLASIRSYIWMALSGKGGAITEKQRYYLERSFASTNRLIKLVNSMLNISRIESGRMAMSLKHISIHTIIKSVLDEVAPKIAELGLVVTAPDPGEYPDVIADPDKVQEVLMNFIGNAMKFTPRGGQIHIKLSKEHEFLRVAVVDSGFGIEPENISKLFTKFGALKSSGTPEAIAMQSTGLGLYISKSIISMHGGSVEAHSKGVDKGSTFIFTLPLYTQEKLIKLQKQFRTEGLGIIHSSID